MTDSPRTITKEEEAVIEAAIDVRDYVKRKGMVCVDELVVAVDALNAPKPVKPEEVEPGTPFRFEHRIESREATGPFVVVSQYGISRVYMDGNFETYDFNQGERIIPDEEQP